MSFFGGIGVRARFVARALSWAVVGSVVMTVAGAATASAQCPLSIRKCGCTITTAGLYTIVNNLSAAPGAVDCIKIRSKGSILNLNGATITGPSDGTSTGAGVHVLKSASGSFVEGSGATLSGWKSGVESDAPNVVIEDFTAQNNDKVGVLVLKTHDNSITNFVAQNNGWYGVWLAGSSQNQIGQGQTLNNQFDGMLIGCPASGQKCTLVGAPSNQNIVYGLTSDNNGLSGDGSGITVQFNSNLNWIGRSSASGNAKFDLNDRHDGTCGKDVWFANQGVGNKPCVD